MLYPNIRYAFYSPARYIGGTGEGFSVYTCARSCRMNRFTGESWSKVAGGLPTGYGVRGTIFPQTEGGMSSYDARALVLTASGTVRDGRTISGTITAECTITGSLASLLSGTITAAVTLTGLIGGRAPLSANAVATGTATATIGASGGLAGTTTATASITASIVAIGSMAGDIVPYTELSPQSLAQAAYDLIYPDLSTINNGVQKASILIPHTTNL